MTDSATSSGSVVQNLVLAPLRFTGPLDFIQFWRPPEVELKSPAPFSHLFLNFALDNIPFERAQIMDIEQTVEMINFV